VLGGLAAADELEDFEGIFRAFLRTERGEEQGGGRQKNCDA
jgi:hypothetical protein